MVENAFYFPPPSLYLTSCADSTAEGKVFGMMPRFEGRGSMSKAWSCIRPVASDEALAAAGKRLRRRRRREERALKHVGAATEAAAEAGAAAACLLPLVEGAHPAAGLRAQAARIFGGF